MAPSSQERHLAGPEIDELLREVLLRLPHFELAAPPEPAASAPPAGRAASVALPGEHAFPPSSSPRTGGCDFTLNCVGVIGAPRPPR